MIKQVVFVKSITHIKDEPFPRYAKIILIGKSNVGKSSFINNLTNRKKIAKVSKTPGKTITLNFYLVDNFFYLVDTPGYGYSKRSKELQKNFLPMVINFLSNDLYLKKIFHLIDFKIGPNQNDLNMSLQLIKNGFEIVWVFTKKDQISKNKIYQQLKKIHSIFALANLSLQKYFLISNKKKEGFIDITDFIFKTLS